MIDSCIHRECQLVQNATAALWRGEVNLVRPQGDPAFRLDCDTETSRVYFRREDGRWFEARVSQIEDITLIEELEKGQ